MANRCDVTTVPGEGRHAVHRCILTEGHYGDHVWASCRFCATEGTEYVPNCELEWQKERGVLYIHNKDTGMTVLRIQGLPVPVGLIGVLTEGMIDIGVKNPELVSLPSMKRPESGH